MDEDTRRARRSQAEACVTLVIGNANYEEERLRLRNPLHDADDVAKVLRTLRFEVIEPRDVTKGKLLEGLDTFDVRLQQAKGRVVLLLWACHAISGPELSYSLTNSDHASC